MAPARSEGSDLGSALTPAPPVPGQHQCPICFRSYKRREHLQRHSHTHTSDRPHRCPACGCSFQRADVLKRHWRTCDGRGSSKAVVRRRACDRCVRQKKACNSVQPCHNCARRGIPCQYSSGINAPKPSTDIHSQAIDIDKDMLATTDPLTSTIEAMLPPSFEVGQFDNITMNAFESFFDPDLFDYASPSWQDFMHFTSDGQPARELTVSDGESSQIFHFLDNFTSKTGFIMSFDCGTLRQRQEVMSNIQCGVLAFEPQQGQRMNFESTNNPEGVSSGWFNDPLALKTHQILLLIKEVVTVKPRNSSVTLYWSPALEQMCLQFFSPINLRKYLELYWAIWSPNVNFVHRPTFDPVSSKSILVASMAIIGACVSPDPVDNENARMWLNCVEEMVFADDDVNSFPVFPFDPAANRRKIQALQACYMVCLYQNWEGTDVTKRRIRRHRYSTVVSIVRDIGVATARHSNYSRKARHEFQWNDFVAKEELIRTFLWIFLLDTAFVIFNNFPPRMVIKEMKNHVAAPEACFQAVTADQCFEQIQMWMPAKSPFWRVSFRSAFETLCRGDLTADMRHILAALGPLNLFAIASAIHYLIFQYQNAFGGGELLQRIRDALGNWKDIWHIQANASPGTSPHSIVDSTNAQPEYMWKRVGFFRYSPDYWLLASLKVDRLSVADPCQPKSNAWTGQNDVELIGEDDDGLADPILNKYDETSMSQVNELISEFKKVQVH
ncbi:hypothetical protein D8B26_000550 [Coccidioides posadasii str. Silveira]|uniref:Uncharacterized protein n=1 Tax=Coccidioides posadasii (strain RMSCC 757 / Silveira) TaxID=443226 RepID=E9DFD0_COCPS|nr:hypothetical protein CPSG_08445 [Coccidioides posadasii str. Silveira]QVM05843.1 hypothetical protein D8B26_000550 [Coccidioides posadasii str. Silveira]